MADNKSSKGKSEKNQAQASAPPAAAATADPAAAPATVAAAAPAAAATAATPPAKPAPQPQPEPKIAHDDCAPDVQQLGEALYAAYIENSHGLAWDGRRCPPWDQLGNNVRSHWCAAALAATLLLAKPDGAAQEHAEELAKLRREHQVNIANLERLKAEHERLAAAVKRVDERQIAAAVAERTKLLDSEVDGLRKKVAQLEKEKASGFKPWQNRRRG